MKIKVEASGWPPEVGDDPVKRAEYVERWARDYDIIIDPEAVEDNAELKYWAKLFLNCLWGKWSMSNDLPSSVITDDPVEFHRILNDVSLKKGAIEMLNENLFMIRYKKRGEFITSHSKYNIVLSLFTTAAGRLKLYDYMEQVASAPHCKLLYVDTDSVFFMHPKGQMPISTGLFLGDMTNQYPNRCIKSFYSTGCKSYVIKMINPKTRKVDYVIKSKGITMNSQVADVIHYDTFKV
jgi:hypothetical protein